MALAAMSRYQEAPPSSVLRRWVGVATAAVVSLWLLQLQLLLMSLVLVSQELTPWLLLLLRWLSLL